MAWNQEIYLNFKYFQENDRFHSFEGDTGIIGFLFISTEDSEIFYTAVMDQLEKTVGALDEANQSLKSKSKKKSILSVFRFGKSSKSEEEEESAERHKRRDIDSSSTRSSRSSGSSGSSREGSSSRSSSIDSRSSRRSESSSHRTESSKPKSKQQEKEKEKDTKKKEKKSTELSHEDVSEPRDFRHLSHIGFNPEKGTFDIKNIPDDWKTLFAKAGITQDQLENRSTANFIAGFVEKAEPMMMNSSKQMKKKPPPPPPPSKSRQAQPQPQPQQSQQSRTSVPPPPPPKKKLSATPAPPPPPPPMKKEVTKSTPTSDLMNSIRNSGALKPVSVSVEEKNTTSKPSPQGADPHSALMASIRSGSTALKPVKNTTPPNSPTRSTSSSDPTDMMAAMLAKALAARNKKLAVESSEDEDEDSNW